LRVQDYERNINAAQGYSELGMHDDALAELDAIPAPLSRRPELVEMRLLILMHARRWKQALPIARKLCEVAPEATGGYIHSAFCLHELGRTKDAREVLLKGPPCLLNEAVFYYNLACYDVALGDRDQAVENLERSFRMDKKFRQFAQNDPDLAAIRSLL
jgi:tetratricopeptide (TPR) repeat protein